MRLIDADALVKDLELMAKFQPEYKQNTILGVCATIKATKPVDAELVRHGRWVARGSHDEDGYFDTHYECSECGSCSFITTKYCYCGAKMDLE